jgi:hypothetical protein
LRLPLERVALTAIGLFSAAAMRAASAHGVTLLAADQ